MKKTHSLAAACLALLVSSGASAQLEALSDIGPLPVISDLILVGVDAIGSSGLIGQGTAMFFDLTTQSQPLIGPLSASGEPALDTLLGLSAPFQPVPAVPAGDLMLLAPDFSSFLP